MNIFQEWDYISVRCENTKAQVTTVIHQFVVYSYWSHLTIIILEIFYKKAGWPSG